MSTVDGGRGERTEETDLGAVREGEHSVLLQREVSCLVRASCEEESFE